MPRWRYSPGNNDPKPAHTEEAEQRLTPTPRRIPLPVPTPGIFDAPNRCVRINLEWWSHISGMIDVLSSPELWEGDDDEQTRAIREIASLLSVIDPCGGIVDCDDVEPCIDSSPTIIEIENNLTEITNNFNDYTDTSETPIGNEYPPAPDFYTPGSTGSNSALCGAAFYTADQIISILTDTYNKESTNSYQTWFANLVTVGGGFFLQLAIDLWAWFVALSDGSFITNLNASRAKIAQAFFCNDFNIPAARADIVADATMNANVKTAVLKLMDSLIPAKWLQWRVIGATTQNDDCGAFCDPWTIVYVFKTGSYTPAAGDIIIDGDTWTKSNCLYSSSRGYYGSTANIWTITHNLPPDAQVTTQYIQAARPPSGTSVQVGCWWRGATGTGSVAITPLVTVAAAPPAGTLCTFSLVNAELASVLGYMDNFGSGTPFDSEIHWIKLVGRGSTPNS